MIQSPNMPYRESTSAILETRFASDIAAAIQPEWETFEAMAASPALQQFCSFESRYAGIVDGTTKLDRYLNYIELAPQTKRFDAHDIAQVLSRTGNRLDNFMQDIIKAYCVYKRKPEPEDAAGERAIISKILVGGIERVRDYTI